MLNFVFLSQPFAGKMVILSESFHLNSARELFIDFFYEKLNTGEWGRNLKR